MATDSATLFEQAKCYLCLGISQAEALQLALLAQIAAGTGGGGNDGLGTGFISANLLMTPSTIPVPHTLGAVPKIVRGVMVCVSNDAGVGITVGQELAFEGVWDTADGLPNFSIWADATTLYIYNAAAIPGGEGNVYGPGGSNFTSFNNWRMKLYAWK